MVFNHLVTVTVRVSCVRVAMPVPERMGRTATASCTTYIGFTIFTYLTSAEVVTQ